LAIGALETSSDPARLLSGLADHSAAILLWTHYQPDAAPGVSEPREIEGLSIRYFPRRGTSPAGDRSDDTGLALPRYRMTRSDIVALLDHKGFGDQVIGWDELDHPDGPCFTLLARKTLSKNALSGSIEA